jgi:predicted GTPase
MRNKTKKVKTPETHNRGNQYIQHELMKYPHYFKHLKDMLEAHETKAKSINMRNQILDAQRRANYKNELSRIQGYLSEINPAIRHNVDRLTRRKEELQGLISQAF